MRYRRFLRRRYGQMLYYLGLVAMVVGGVLLLPLLALAAYPGEWRLAGGFLLPGGTTLLLGIWRWRHPPNCLEPLTLAEGAVVVVLGWLLAIAVSTVPYMAVGLSLTQAWFEATSGWTTTGLSVVDVTRASPLVLLLRSLTQLFGGAGFAIIAVSAIATSPGVGFTTAEGRGEQLVPNVRHSAKLVLAIYGSYGMLGTLALHLAGMGWFDAVNHAFCALSTGGFSTRPDSIGHWPLATVEFVTLGLMVGGSLNFLTVYLLLRGRWRAFLRNSELRLQTALFLGGSLVLLAVTTGLFPWPRAGRAALFEAMTALSTTGFATISYGAWSGLGAWGLICLMVIGGGTGSTAGGIKLLRGAVLLRGLLWHSRSWLLPPTALTEPHVWQGEQRRFLDANDLARVGLFLALYLLAVALGTGVLSAYGYSLQDSLFECVSSLSTVGLSSGITAPTAPAGVLWTEIVAMLLGRLEFFPVIVGGLRLWQDGKAWLGR